MVRWPKNYKMANKGRATEDLVTMSNRQYENRGIAIIHKVPTEWLPIRDSKGKIVSAKVDKKSIVDHIGSYKGVAIAFDDKETKNHRIALNRVEPHQAKFLDAWVASGGIGFILVAYTAERKYYVIPWAIWKQGMIDRKAGKGMASLAVEDFDKPIYIVKA